MTARFGSTRSGAVIAPLVFGAFLFVYSWVQSQQFQTVALRANAAAAQIIIDPSNPTATEITVNEDNMLQLKPRVIDSAGNVIENAPLAYKSLSEDIAKVNVSGNIQGMKAGFSTLTVSSGAVVATATITVVAVTSGAAGYEITGVAQDLARRLYLANTRDHTILLAENLQKAPNIYAGTNQQPGLINAERANSRFRNPAFLAFNQAEGSLYVSDSANNVIRRVRPGLPGKVETLAGTGQVGSQDGSLNQAAFNNPQGVALDNRGFLWVVDSGNHTVRRIDLVSGTVQTMAGKAGSPGSADGIGDSARFNSPLGIAVEDESLAQQLERERRGDARPPASVIVADTGNGLLRRVKETGQVETLGQFATKNEPSSMPYASTNPPLSPSPVSLLAASPTLLLPPSPPLPLYHSAAVPQAAAPLTFRSPTGVAVDPFGNVYVSETSSGQVKTILQNKTVVPAAQSNTFSGPNGIAITRSGKVVIADSNRSGQEITYGAPVISSVTPDQISSRGGAKITIKGRNFAPDTLIVAAGVVISDIKISDTETISLTAPSLPSGRTTLTAQNRGGLAQHFLVVDAIPFRETPPGYITTIAGGSTFVGDGSAATDVPISPLGVAVDTFGNLYIADVENNRVRRVDIKTGIISTVAGNGDNDVSGDNGPAVAAALSMPRAMTFDTAGNLFIAHGGATRIRKVDIATGIITTVAGSGEFPVRALGDDGPATAAQLSTVLGIAADGDGNLFIADTLDHRIRKVDAKTRVITTVAGSGPSYPAGGSFSGDNGQATAATLNEPRGVALDVSGNLFIADSENNRIRRVDARTQIITTVAGSGPTGPGVSFSGDNGPATAATLGRPQSIVVDAAGNLFITGNSRIRKVDARTNIITTVAGNGSFDFSTVDAPATTGTLRGPTGIAVDAAGNLFVADEPTRRIRKVDAITEIITTVAGNGQEFFLGDNGPATAAALRRPTGIAFDSAGNLLIADTLNQRIRKVDSITGIINTVAGTGSACFCGDNGPVTDAGISFPKGISLDAAGNLYFADNASNRIRKIDAATRIITTVAGSGPTDPPPDFSGENVPATVATLNRPEGIALDAFGNLFIADTGNNRIRRVDGRTKIITTVAGNGQKGLSGDDGLAVAAALNVPIGIAVDSAGNVFFADAGNDRIRKLAVDTGIITTVAGGGKNFPGDSGLATDAVLGFPRAVAVDASGNLFITDSNNGRIRKVDAKTSIITTVAGSSGRGLSGDNGPATAATFVEPLGVAIDGAGNLIIADGYNSRVRAVRAAPRRRRP